MGLDGVGHLCHRLIDGVGNVGGPEVVDRRGHADVVVGLGLREFSQEVVTDAIIVIAMVIVINEVEGIGLGIELVVMSIFATTANE